jgi:hypothetical protein
VSEPESFCRSATERGHNGLPIAVLVLGTPLLVWGLAGLPGGRWLLPIAVPLTLYPLFRPRVERGDYGAAYGVGMLWAALLSLSVITLVYFEPERARAGILHGQQYAQEMMRWVEIGSGTEVTPRAFLPQHLLHLCVFALLTWVSGGYLGLALGAALVGYMSYFVGIYAVASGHPWMGPVIAWVPWSVVRVAAFVLLGALLSRPLLRRRLWPLDFGRTERRLLTLALAGIVCDLVLKTLAAPAYGRFLREFLGP